MGTSDIRIKQIPPEATYPIRQQILRPGRPIEEVLFEGDTENTAVHLGAFLRKELVGIATFVKNSHREFNVPEQYQLRGMAVLPEARNLQVGQSLLIAGEALLKNQRNLGFLWCNARETAVEFYRKNKYNTHGDYFEIPNVCTHIVMYKYL